jgi:hypothetical protein
MFNILDRNGAKNLHGKVNKKYSSHHNIALLQLMIALVAG